MKKISRKLTLNRETLRNLIAENLVEVAGGTSPDPPSRISCVRPICPIQHDTASNCCA
jgi:hypothetical protein